MTTTTTTSKTTSYTTSKIIATDQKFYKLQYTEYIVKVPSMVLRGNTGLPTPFWKFTSNYF